MARFKRLDNTVPFDSIWARRRGRLRAHVGLLIKQEGHECLCELSCGLCSEQPITGGYIYETYDDDFILVCCKCYLESNLELPLLVLRDEVRARAVCTRMHGCVRAEIPLACLDHTEVVPGSVCAACWKQSGYKLQVMPPDLSRSACTQVPIDKDGWAPIGPAALRLVEEHRAAAAAGSQRVPGGGGDKVRKCMSGANNTQGARKVSARSLPITRSGDEAHDRVMQVRDADGLFGGADGGASAVQDGGSTAGVSISTRLVSCRKPRQTSTSTCMTLLHMHPSKNTFRQCPAFKVTARAPPG